VHESLSVLLYRIVPMAELAVPLPTTFRKAA